MTEDRPGCVHHIHLAPRHGDPEFTLVCACPAGLIHMHDCPVMNGRECRHFEAGDGEPLETAAYEEAHTALMADFLSRPYLHRVRGLPPGRSAFEERRRELAERYAEDLAEDVRGDDLTPDQEERYAEEKERLIAQRKRREEARAEREAKTREEKARERAKMGIKTVVERAQESIAARGNVSDSIVDAIPSPEGTKPKRRRRRRKPGDAKPGESRPRSANSGDSNTPDGKASPAPKAEGDSPPRKRRRRRRRRGPRKQGDDSA